MFSGKTSRLIQEYKTRKYIGCPVAVLNYAGDTRYSNSATVVSHDLVSVPCLMTYDLKDEWQQSKCLRSANVILINEAQFFENLFEVVVDMVENYNKEVFIYGLDADSNRCLFGEIYKLIPYADSIEKLTSLCSICKDGTPAIHSMRMVENDEQVLIGADDIYKPVCRSCYRGERSSPLTPLLSP
jgi:thymidine kinase